MQVRRPLGGVILAASALVAVAVAGSAGPGSAARSAVPADSTPITISFSGSSDLTNTAVPQKTVSSYTRHAQWRYSWSGTWGGLFRDKTVYTSGALPFQTVSVSVRFDVVYKDKLDGPSRSCTVRMGADPATPPRFMASYDGSAGKIQIGLYEGAFRLVNQSSSDPGCLGGAGGNILGAPADFTSGPFAGGTVDIEKGGTVRVDRSWSWTYVYPGDLDKARRNYTAKLRTDLTVGSSACTPGRAPSTRSAKSPPAAAPCVEILHKGKPLSNGATVRVVAGEPVRLTVRLKDSKKPVKQPIAWKVERASDNLAATSALGGYRVTASSASATKWSSVPLARATLGPLYLIRNGTFKVSVQTGSGVASASFATDFPSIRPEVTHCDVALNTKLTIQGQKPQWLGPGWNDKCPYAETLGAGRPGIEWKVRVDGPTGTVSMIQLISVTVRHGSKVCWTVSEQADDSVFYDQDRHPDRAEVEVPGTWHDRDSPHLALPVASSILGDPEWSKVFSAKDQLMFKSSIPGSIWVSIGRMSWGWTGFAKRGIDGWREEGSIRVNSFGKADAPPVFTAVHMSGSGAERERGC